MGPSEITPEWLAANNFYYESHREQWVHHRGILILDKYGTITICNGKINSAKQQDIIKLLDMLGE